MNNKTVIISGSGSLAMAFASKLQAEDWQVAMLGRKKPENFSGIFLNCDFNQPEQIRQAVRLAKENLGSFSAAVHTAVSRIVRKRILDISAEDFTQSFSVDIFGGFVFLQSAAEFMKDQGFGHLVAISTEAVENKEAPMGMAGYASAKYALKGMLKIFKQELEKKQIAVCALAPGFMETKLNSDLPPRLIDFIKEQQGGQLISPDQVAETLNQILNMPFNSCSGKNFFIKPGHKLNVESRDF